MKFAAGKKKPAAKKDPAGSESAEVLAKLQKDFGAQTVRKGARAREAVRIPTGIFPLDLATGGGIPRERLSIIFGPEGSGKTTVLLKTIAQAQAAGETAALIDIENSYDPLWGARLGVDNERLIVAQPDSAEQAVDITEGLMYAKDVGIIGLDSIAALTSENEIQSGAEKMIVGGASMLTTKLMKKLGIAFSREAKREHYPALVMLNQIRHKIGQMFGDPETQPGGNMLRFTSSLTIRLYGKSVIVEAVNKTHPAIKETSGIIKKWKVPITGTVFKYDMLILPQGKRPVGYTESWATVSNYLRDLGDLGHGDKGKGWVCLGNKFDKLDEIEEMYRSDPLFMQLCQQTIFEKAKRIYEASDD